MINLRGLASIYRLSSSKSKQNAQLQHHQVKQLMCLSVFEMILIDCLWANNELYMVLFKEKIANLYAKQKKKKKYQHGKTNCNL